MESVRSEVGRRGLKMGQSGGGASGLVLVLLAVEGFLEGAMRVVDLDVVRPLGFGRFEVHL